MAQMNITRGVTLIYGCKRENKTAPSKVSFKLQAGERKAALIEVVIITKRQRAASQKL